MMRKDMILRAMYNECFVFNNVTLYESYNMIDFKFFECKVWWPSYGSIVCFLCFDSCICFQFLWF